MPLTLITITLLAAAVFLGVIAGYILCIIAPEEIRGGYIYFVLMQNTVFSILIAVITIFIVERFTDSIAAMAFPLLSGVAAFALLYMRNIAGKLYIFSGIPLYLLAESTPYMIVSSTLIFLFGIAVAGVFAYGYVSKDGENIKSRKKLLKRLMLNYAWFIPVMILPFLISYL